MLNGFDGDSSGLRRRQIPDRPIHLERARSLGMSRSDLVRRLGYTDIDSGHEAFSAPLFDQYGSTECGEPSCWCFPVDL
jgi:hypothetical protein